MPLLVPLLSRHLQSPNSRELLRHLAGGGCNFKVEGPADEAMDQARKIVPHTISFLRLFSPTWSNLAAAALSTDSPEAWHLLLTSSDALAAGVKTLEGPAQLVALEGDSAIDVLRLYFEVPKLLAGIGGLSLMSSPALLCEPGIAELAQTVLHCAGEQQPLGLARVHIHSLACLLKLFKMLLKASLSAGRSDHLASLQAMLTSKVEIAPKRSASLLWSLVNMLTGHRPPSVAIDRAHDILALCLEHAEQLPRAACFLLFNCRFLAVVERHLEQPKPQVVPSSKGSEGRVQADKQTAKALLTGLARTVVSHRSSLAEVCGPHISESVGRVGALLDSPPFKPVKPLWDGQDIQPRPVTAASAEAGSSTHRTNEYIRDVFKQPAQSVQAWQGHWISLGLDALETELKSPETGKFCHGDSMTVADCYLVPQCFNLLWRPTGLDLAKWPTIKCIYENCLKEPAVQQADPFNQPDAPRSDKATKL
eukprot:jgi/Astpho2/8575/fgenesh1_pg.00126_%23_5_t